MLKVQSRLNRTFVAFPLFRSRNTVLTIRSPVAEIDASALPARTVAVPAALSDAEWLDLMKREAKLHAIRVASQRKQAEAHALREQLKAMLLETSQQEKADNALRVARARVALDSYHERV